MRWSPTGWIAEFADEDGGEPRRFGVERWAVNGDAMIGHESGRLVAARKQPGFLGIHKLTGVVAVVPAAPGWTVEADMFGDLMPFTAPIAAWVLTDDGVVQPIIDKGWEPGTNPDPRGSWALQVAGSSRHHIVPPPQ